MKPTYTVATFDGGIVERVKQDVFGEAEGGRMRSVLWLENFDHTIVIGSAVKRQGYKILTETTPWSGPMTNWHQGSMGTAISFQVADFCSDWDTYDPNSELNHVIGTASYAYNIPVGQNVLISFVRFYSDTDRSNAAAGTFYEADYNATVVVAYARQVPSDTAPVWSNVWTKDKGLGQDPHAGYEYPGWFSYGIMRDHTVYGGSVVFVTDFNNEVEPFDPSVETPRTDNPMSLNMYPVYVFKLWDISNRRDKGTEFFWDMKNISTQTNTNIPLNTLVPNYSGDDYQRFKIIYPSMWLLRNDLVGVVECGSEADIYQTALTKPIELCLFERRVRSFETKYFPIGVNGSNTRFNADTEQIEPSSKWEYINDEADFTESLETLRSITYAVQEVKWEEGLLYSDGNVAGITAFENDWKETALTVNWMGRNISMQCITKGDIYASELENRQNNLGDPIDQSGKMREPTNGDKKLWDSLGRWVLPVRLPNYIGNKNPRYWMQGEKIPLVITGKVNGIELKLFDYVYEVRNAHSDPWPNLWSLMDQEHWEAYIDSEGAHEYWSAASRRELFWAVKDNNMKCGGRYIVPKTCLWTEPVVTLGPGITTTPDTHYVFPSWRAYCWEPFNPFVRDDFTGLDSANDPYTDFWYPRWDHGGITNQGATQVGYWPRHCEGNIIGFNLRIDKDYIAKLVDVGLEEVNVYIVEASEDESLLRSQGLFAYTKDVPSQYYGLPKKKFWDNDPQNYRLLHSFSFTEDAKGFADVDDYETWKQFYDGQPGTTSAWSVFDDRMVGTPQNEDGSFVTNAQIDANSGSRLTPEYVIYDYGVSGPSMILNSDARYWDGIAARCVAQVKGRVFIAGLTKKGGEEEQGIVRFSAVQSGVISLDVFNEADSIRLGGKPVTALMEYREQLWIFGDTELHRVQMPVITDTSSWEVLDKIDGQGVSEPKLVTTCPYGVVWANGAGVWISDGRMPENLADPVLGAYMTLMTGQPYPFQSFVQLPIPAVYDGTYNKYATLEYLPLKDEVMISFPVTEVTRSGGGITSVFVEDLGEIIREVRLIYHFPSKTWRCETYDLTTFGEEVTQEYGNL